MLKTNDEILRHLQAHQWDSVRYACLARLQANRLDAEAWAYLGHSMIGL